MNEINYLEIFKESFTLVILLFCSVISITFVIERWLYFRRSKLNNEDFLGRIKRHLEGGHFKEAVALCDKHRRSPVAQVVRVALLNHQRSRVQVEELMAATRMEERVKMERFLGILGTLGNTTPFIGLFGTVVGIIKAFRDLAAAGTGGPTVVAKGIAEALVATAAGLSVAIPAVIFFNYFMRRVKVLSSGMESASLRVSAYLGLK